MFSSAGQAEIIRSNQKDHYYIGYIKSALADNVQLLLGSRRWIQWRKEVDLIADLAYFGLTTFAGYQTLGEEYVNIVPVDESKRALPTQWRRTLMILLQVAAPYAINKLLTRMERHLQQNAELHLDPDARAKLLRAISVIRHTVTIAHRCHLAAFYMRGVFYHIAKRLTGTRYVLIRSTRGDSDNATSNYGVLGWLSVLQLTFTFAQQLCKWFRLRHVTGSSSVSGRSAHPDIPSRGTSLGAESDSPVELSRKCSLCLEPRFQSTATPCGHLFCYSCITEWAVTKVECPLCREPFEMSRLIFLQHYDPR